MKISAYMCLTADSGPHLDEIVRFWLNSGYELLGSPSCAVTMNGSGYRIETFTQAVVKYETPEATRMPEIPQETPFPAHGTQGSVPQNPTKPRKPPRPLRTENRAYPG